MPPYAFQDRFDPNPVCKHSDGEERYSFKNQPTMGLFAVSKLGNALAKLINCQEAIGTQAAKDVDTGVTGSAELMEVAEGWAADRAKLGQYKTAAKAVIQLIKQDFTKHFMDEYTRLTRLRLGFVLEQANDFTIASEFLTVLVNFDLNHSKSHCLLS